MYEKKKTVHLQFSSLPHPGEGASRIEKIFHVNVRFKPGWEDYLFSWPVSQITVAATADPFLRIFEIRYLFAQLKKEPNNVTKQDQNTMILLDFNVKIEKIKYKVSVATPVFGSWFGNFNFQMWICITCLIWKATSALKMFSFILCSHRISSLFLSDLKLM